MENDLSPTDFILSGRKEATANAIGSLADDPEAAARAVELSRSTGVPAPIIHSDLEGFEQQHKAALTASLLDNNEYLRQFIQGDPMAAKVANDDYANLDAVSQKISQSWLPRSVRQWLDSDSIAQSLAKGFGDAPIGHQAIKPWEGHPVATSLAAAAVTVPEVFFRSVNAAIVAAADLVAEGGDAISPGLGRDLGAMLEAEAMGLTGRGHAAKPAMDVYNKVRPWIENGKEPPPTVLPEFDKMRAEQNVADLDAIKEITQEAQKSATRERSPDLFKQFIVQHTDAEIGISGEAVAALYGDKLPLADDGLLGWVPNIAEKLELAKSTGDDVRIPLADWVTHVDPKVMDALHDDIRVRPNGITAREATLQGEPKPPPLPGEVPAARDASALEPMLSVGDRKLSLERLNPATTGRDLALRDGANWDTLRPETQRFYEETAANHNQNNRFGPAQGFHDFQLLDEKGSPVGYINLSTQKGGKDLYVEMVSGVNGLGPKDFGPRLMRDLLMQLKQEFPEAERLGGFRVSGAREKSGKMAEAWINLDVGDGEALRQIMEDGQWWHYSPSVQAFIKPDFARSEQTQMLVQTINEEMNRIVPKKVQGQVAESIKVDASGIAGQRAGEDIAVAGIYIRTRDAYPILLAALDQKDTLGSMRHEAIHHLRQYGFFTTDEWSTLSGEALTGKWIEKYKIDRLYPTANLELKIEEAIAERYRHWVREGHIEEMSLTEQTMFQRLKEFLDIIRQKVADFFNKTDPTWEDIFQKVDTGEIGSREGTQAIDPRSFDPRLSRQEDINSALDALGKALGYDPSKAETSSKPEAKGIKSAAIKYDGKVYTGAIHPDAVMKIAEERGIDVSTDALFSEFYTREYDKMQEGFLTDTGDFVGRQEAADIAQRAGQYKQERRGNASLDSLEIDPMLSVSDGPRVFERAAALGMTVEQFKAYDKLIQQRHAEDIAAATKRAEAEKARELTKEWKSNRADLRKEVAESIRNRPDVAVDLFLSGDGLYGRRTKMAYKLDAAALSDKQKAMLPPEYYGKDGLNPDDLANLFGYGSGEAMVDKLAAYNVNRRAVGMSSKDYVNRITDIETDRQMKLKYGVLEDNIMDAVNEQVTGETQQNILHEETVKLGMEVGAAPLDKAAILKGLRDQFAKMPLGTVDSAAYMKAAGKAGRNAELALLNQDPAMAFQAKQQQYYATVIANEAAKLEKDLGKFDKVAKRFSKREVTGIDPAYTNFVHDILQRVGKQVRRSVQDIATEIEAGEFKSLQEFVEGKNGFYLREVAVADMLFDPAFRKKFEDLTVDEFRAVNDSIKSLVKNGRDEQKITKAGTEADLGEIKSQMIESLERFGEKTYDAKGGRWMGPIPPKVAKVLRTYGAAHIQIENLFNRWDHDDPNGVFQQYVMRDLVDATNSEAAMEKRYATKLRKLDDKADLKKQVDNPLFKVPGTDQLMKLNRGNLRAILLNMGNESNMSKLARGYKIEPAQLWAWVHQHAEKADWDWAQKMGDVFAELKGEADVMYRQLSGVAPEAIEIKPVETPHGVYKGWYYPIIYHPEFEGPSKKLMGKDALEGEGYVRATVANGYTKSRTGYAGPMALDLDMMPARMKQMIHDISMRPSIINASKIFYDKDIRQTVFNRFGGEWRDMLVPYLVDVANAANYVPKDQRMFVQASEFLRQNLVSTLVGLNPGTVMKHGPTAFVQSMHEVGYVKFNQKFFGEVLPEQFLKGIKSLFSIGDRTGETQWQFAMRTSEELQRRHQNYVETLGGATDLLQSPGTTAKIPFTNKEVRVPNTYPSLRATVQRFASAPVAFSDLLSAVPTWLAQYEKSLSENPDRGNAVYMADRAVRRAHGSVAITNRSGVMRGGALGQWFASVYGFFNHIMNRQYELLWKSGEAIGMIKDGDYKAAMKQAPELTSMLFAYVLAPALIEELVTPLASDDHESWGKKGAKGLAFTLGASWVGVRDVANAMLNGRDPSVGLISTAGKTVTDFARDLNKQGPFNKEHAGKVVRDGATLLGALTGVVPTQVGRAAQFSYGIATGTERPKGPWGWLVGARYGTLKNHSQTFDEYVRHMKGH